MIAAKDGTLRHGDIIDGRYRIGRELGQGAMGIVYEAQHLRLTRRVAVKVLRDELTSDNDSCERFEREARAAGRIGSQHIVNVHDAGELPNGQRYLVMEYLRGETLKEYFNRLAPVPPEELLPIMAQLLEGLAAAHDAGIIHRDVKPENIYLVATPEEPLVKIVDFGVSKFRDAGTNALQSRTGLVLGTPHYMSPEQARGLREVDRRADVFSAGIVLYEGLCGRRPFSAPNVNQLLFQIALDDVPSLEERMPGVDPGLAAIVRRATARDADARYQSARQFGDDIVAWLHGDEIEALQAPSAPSRERIPVFPAGEPDGPPVFPAGEPDGPPVFPAGEPDGPPAGDEHDIADEETRESPPASLPVGLHEAAVPTAPARPRSGARPRSLAIAALGVGAIAMVALASLDDAATLRASLPIPQLWVSPPALVAPPDPPPAMDPVASASSSGDSAESRGDSAEGRGDSAEGRGNSAAPPRPPVDPAPPSSKPSASAATSKTPRPFRKDL